MKIRRLIATAVLLLGLLAGGLGGVMTSVSEVSAQDCNQTTGAGGNNNIQNGNGQNSQESGAGNAGSNTNAQC